MGQSRAATNLIVRIVAIGVAVTQGATAQETPPKGAQGYINRGIAHRNKGDNESAIADLLALQRL